jgi:acyl-coenzyme A thioesterase PaaI-like protein
MNVSPKLFKRIINLYPPYLGAGVKVEYISEDWKELHVSLILRWYNRNAVGTHFGGSLYSMIDPHLMLLLMQLLGKEYLVWDKSAKIEFVKASKKKVKSIIKVSDKILEDIRDNTENGDKYFPKFLIEIRDEEDDLIATCEKVIYVKKSI